MRIALALIGATMALFAKDPSVGGAAASACGPMNATFDVQKDSSPQPILKPDPGRALVYVVQEDCAGWGCPSSKVVVDGAWVGVNLNKSYFSFPVNPGVHHVCATLQSRSSIEARFVGLLHFTAEPGAIYYLRTRLLYSGPGIVAVDLEAIEQGSGQLPDF
jgi:hypothetical protein